MSNYNAMDRDELIDQYIEHLYEDERMELLFDLLKESTKDCYMTEWLRNVLYSMDKEES